MRIEISKEQYKALLELTAMSAHVISSVLEDDDELIKYEDALNHIWSYYKRFDMEEYIEYDEVDDKHYPTRALDDKIIEYMGTYDEEAMWDNLTIHMARVELDNKNIPLEIEPLLKHQEKYYEEFAKYGVMRLFVDWKKKIDFKGLQNEE